MMKLVRKRVSAVAVTTLLLLSGFSGPVIADNANVDVSDSRVQVIKQNRKDKASSDSAPVNENRDASDSPVVQPVASMRGQTCIASGGLEVPCETDNGWFYAPKSCYATKKLNRPVAKYHTAFECKKVGNNLSLGEFVVPTTITVPTSEAEARATAAKKGSKLAEDALADYDFEKLTVRTQPSDTTMRPDAFVFTQGYVWAWVPPSKARSSSQRNPLVSEATDGGTHVKLQISFLAMNVHFDGQSTGTQGFIQCDDPGPVYAGEPRGGSACSWKAKKQDVYQVRSSILYRVEWTADDESGVLIHEVPMDGVQLIRVQDGYAVNVK